TAGPNVPVISVPGLGDIQVTSCVMPNAPNAGGQGSVGLGFTNTSSATVYYLQTPSFPYNTIAPGASWSTFPFGDNISVDGGGSFELFAVAGTSAIYLQGDFYGLTDPNTNTCSIRVQG